MRLKILACVLMVALVAQRSFAAPPIDLTSPQPGLALQALHDASWGLTNCTLTVSSLTVTCPAPASFTMPSNAYTALLIADDAGSSGGARAPYVGRITGTMNTGGILTIMFVNLGGAATYNMGTGTSSITHVAQLDVGAGGSGYTFGSTQTLVCSTCMTGDGHVDATGTPGVMAVTGVALSNGGTGGTGSSCSTLQSVSQVGLAGNVTLFSGNISGMGILTSVSVTTGHAGQIANDYVTPSSGVYTERLVGCGYTPTTGPTVTVTYTVLGEQLTAGTGIYVGAPPCFASAAGVAPITEASGLTLSCSSSGETFPDSGPTKLLASTR